jgi:hypothetical protein
VVLLVTGLLIRLRKRRGKAIEQNVSSVPQVDAAE